MIISGAGGHGIEVFQTLISMGIDPDEIYFFDEDKAKKRLFALKEKVVVDLDKLQNLLKNDPRFTLGIGASLSREKMYIQLNKMGGDYFPIKGACSIDSSKDSDFDRMPFSFAGPNTKIGKGVLLNTRAHIHHDCEIGSFSEIGPGALILGGAKIGEKCRIGAGAVVLPGINLGHEVVVGAGSVVTKDFGNNTVLIGVPASIK